MTIRHQITKSDEPGGMGRAVESKKGCSGKTNNIDIPLNLNNYIDGLISNTDGSFVHTSNSNKQFAYYIVINTLFNRT